MKSSISKLVLATSVLLCFVAGPSQAASGMSFANLSGAEYESGGVFVKGDVLYTATNDDGGGFDQLQFRIFDDFVVKFTQTFQLAVGLSGSFHFEAFYPGFVATIAPGVGLVLDDIPNSSFDDVVDPFFPTRYADPSECQIDCGPVAAIPEPSEYALILMGLGVVGWAARRRSQAAA